MAMDQSHGNGIIVSYYIFQRILRYKDHICLSVTTMPFLGFLQRPTTEALKLSMI